VRLNKRLAELGLCSRREADEWIERGWVRVNGQVAVMGLKVSAQDQVAVDRRADAAQAERVTILLHKPMGYVSGQAEDGHQPAVTLVNARSHWRGDASRQRFTPTQLRGLAPAGRLDIDSVGLLVLTQDGRVARQLIGEDSSVDKEYLVRVSLGEVATNVQAVFPPAQLARLRHGLALDGQPSSPRRWTGKTPSSCASCCARARSARSAACASRSACTSPASSASASARAAGQLPVGQWRYLGPDETF
jgi:23S rRNA pseudouridine2604 synthase